MGQPHKGSRDEGGASLFIVSTGGIFPKWDDSYPYAFEWTQTDSDPMPIAKSNTECHITVYAFPIY